MQELEPSPEMRAAAKAILEKYEGVQAFEEGRDASQAGEPGTPALNKGFMAKYFPPKDNNAQDYIAVLDTEMGSPVGDSVVFVMDK